MAYQWTDSGIARGAAHGNVNYYDQPWSERMDALRLQEAMSRSPDSQFSRSLEASTLPHRLQQQRFNALLPHLLGAFNASRSVGGQSGASPEITVGPVWNQQQIQQRVNASRAATDQATAARTRQAQQQYGARGFGRNSPLLAALGAQFQNQALASNVANEREMRLGAREQNARHLLNAQMAREQQFASRQQEDIARRQQAVAQGNALLASLASLV